MSKGWTVQSLVDVVVGAGVIGGPVSGDGKVVSDIVGTSSAVTLLSVCAPWSDIEGVGAVNDDVGISSEVALSSVCPCPVVCVLVDDDEVTMTVPLMLLGSTAVGASTNEPVEFSVFSAVS